MMSSTPARLAVGGVDDEHVDAGVAQRLGALPGVAEEADRGADAQAALARPSWRSGTSRSCRSP